MTVSEQPPQPPRADAEKLAMFGKRFDQALDRLADAKSFAKPNHTALLVDTAARILPLEGGVEFLYERASEFDRAGVFAESDWANPERLRPRLVPMTIASGNPRLVALECLSELRWLAIAEGRCEHPAVTQEDAQQFVHEVLVQNLDYVFERRTEAARGRIVRAAHRLFGFLAKKVGFAGILDNLIEEIYRILRQRPIQVNHVKRMVTEMAVALHRDGVSAPRGADRLISALYGPTSATQEDPGLDVYRERLATMDGSMLSQEAGSFSRAMHDTGLVSPYHAVFMQFALENATHLLPHALGLSSTGSDALLCYRELVHALIKEAIHPETAEAVYGLAWLLERGTLYAPPIAPALWRQIQLPLMTDVEQVFAQVFGTSLPARVHLLAGVICLLGMPIGVGQGENPTCQSARALSMWAYNDPDFLLQLLAWAARDGEITMHFEGQSISSRELQAGLAQVLHLDLDPVSLVLVPHLDRIYMEMGRMAAGRGEDPHKWVNPEFHGWWVGRGFAIAVDIATGFLQDYEKFVRRFYASYHPYYNGNQPVIHPQPAGIAVTDSHGRFVGWHAITILRVALDNEQKMRVYFYNPNNDSGQDWGHGVVVSTEGHGEVFGEASLPADEFASRLYIFHYDKHELGELGAVPEEEVASIRRMAVESWAANRAAAAV